MLKKFKQVSAVATAILTLSACATEQVAVKLIHQSSQCRVEHKTLRLLSSQDQVQDVLPRRLPPGLDNASSPLSEIDFASQQVVLVAWGRQNNAGYALELLDEYAEVKNGNIILPLAFKQPSPDGLYAQVITSPCMIITWPKIDYRTIIAGELEVKSS